MSSWSRNGFRENDVVIWPPNQIFENSEERAMSCKGSRPFALARRAWEKHNALLRLV